MDRREFLQLTAAAGAAAVLPLSAEAKSDGISDADIKESWEFCLNQRVFRFNHPDHTVVRCDVDMDLDPSHLFCGTFNEMVEAWYHYLADLLHEFHDKYQHLDFVMAHPATIYHLMAYPCAWEEDESNRSHTANRGKCIWKAGTRAFWDKVHPCGETPKVCVFANRVYDTSFAKFSHEDYWCGSYNPIKNSERTDRIDFGYVNDRLFHRLILYTNWEGADAFRRRAGITGW